MGKVYQLPPATWKGSLEQRQQMENSIALENLRSVLRHNSTPRTTPGTWLFRSLLGFVALLILTSCATPPPQVVAVPCPAFPPRPVVDLPEVGHYHKALTSILQNVSTPKSLTPAITP